MNWTEKHIIQLKQQGKIRGFHGRKPASPKSETQPVKSKAIAWLDANLQYWANEHSLMLEKEHRFCPERKWRFDYAIPSVKIAVEYEGGIFMAKSGHNTAKHYTKDTEKYNKATVLGWRVIRVTAMNYKTVLLQLNELLHGNEILL